VDKPEAISRKVGLTRRKAALVAVLAVVLLVVLYLQFGPSGADYVPLQDSAPSRRAASSSIPTSAMPAASRTTIGGATRTNGRAAPIDETHWKAPDLAAVIAFDPFAVPATFPKSEQILAVAAQENEAGSEDPAVAAELLTEAVDQLRLELEELQQRGVHVIVKQRDQYVAMIGDRTVHVGDEIGGFTVTAIEPDHVRVERKVQK
jgi:hypothetical protein